MTEPCSFKNCLEPRTVGTDYCLRHSVYLRTYQKKKERMGYKPMTLEQRKAKMEHGLNKRIGRKNATP